MNPGIRDAASVAEAVDNVPLSFSVYTKQAYFRVAKAY
jgi:hypothetical protein